MPEIKVPATLGEDDYDSESEDDDDDSDEDDSDRGGSRAR